MSETLPNRLARYTCVAGPACTDAAWCDQKAACVPSGRPETVQETPTP